MVLKPNSCLGSRCRALQEKGILGLAAFLHRSDMLLVPSLTTY